MTCSASAIKIPKFSLDFSKGCVTYLHAECCGDLPSSFFFFYTLTAADCCTNLNPGAFMFILMHTSEWFKKKRLSRIDGLQDERKSIIISDSIKAMQTYQQNHMMPICSTISFFFPSYLFHVRFGSSIWSQREIRFYIDSVLCSATKTEVEEHLKNSPFQWKPNTDTEPRR